MATRIKTVEYAWPTRTTAVTDATLTSLGTITVYIPETTRTFRSAYVEIGFMDRVTATGGTITEYRVAVQLGAAAANTITETDDITHTGENVGGVLMPFDYTSYFTSNFGSGSSQTCDCSVYFDQNTGTTLGMINVTAKLVVTYEYDDAATTHVKTVRIPLESRSSVLSTSTGAQIGTDQIPQLTGVGGLLPEASVTIRDYFFVVEGNEANNAGTTDWTLSMQIDSVTAVAFGSQESGLASDRYCRWILSLTGAVPTTTTTHQFKMWATAARLMNACITLVVTYEFNVSTTTRTLNSVILPLHSSSPVGGTTSAEASRLRCKFDIEEPGTITLVQSGVQLTISDATTMGIWRVRAGSQAYRIYAHGSGSGVPCGNQALQHRIDSGSAQGVGATLARGENSIVVDTYRDDTTAYGPNLSGFVLLNYQSDVAAAGVGTHNHTVLYVLAQFDALATALTNIATFAPSIPETTYRITSIGYSVCLWSAATDDSHILSAALLSGEGDQAGYRDLRAAAYKAAGELSFAPSHVHAGQHFYRYAGDPDTERMNPKSSRTYRWYTPSTGRVGLVMLVTYHDVTFTVAGTVTGYSGDGSGVTVVLHDATTGDKLTSTTTAIGGTYSLTWYDNTRNVFTQARQDATKLGRSDDGVAV